MNTHQYAKQQSSNAIATISYYLIGDLLTRLSSIIYDPKVVDVADVNAQVRVYTITTTASSQLAARTKIRLWSTFLRPHRTITNMHVAKIEDQGLVLKTYQYTVETIPFLSRILGSRESGATTATASTTMHTSIQQPTTRGRSYQKPSIQLIK